MTNLERYIKIFKESFKIEDTEQIKELEYQSVPSWDSVGHMDLIASIEDEFDIMMETDDIINFSSYTVGIEMLKKYGVEI